jgi:Transposase
MGQRGVPRAAVRNRTNGWSSVAAQRDRAWVGIDVGKTHHWACVVDVDGKKLLSIKVANDEAAIVALIADAGSQATQLDWAVDIIGAPSALLLALLARADQPVRYASGRGVAAMNAAYVGEGKTDAKDAYVIAETARLRGDLPIIDTDTPLIRELAVLMRRSRRRPGTHDQPAA